MEQGDTGSAARLVSPVQPEHVDGVIVPEAHHQHVAPLHALAHRPQAALVTVSVSGSWLQLAGYRHNLVGVVIVVLEDDLLLGAHGVRDGVPVLHAGLVGHRVLDHLPVLDQSELSI